MKIHVWLNEREITREIAADLPLLEFVRSEGCYSVKRGCETSNCGLCTVWIDHKPVLSCSVLAARADGTHITTLEGVEDRAKEFGTYLAKQGGEQCHPADECHSPLYFWSIIFFKILLLPLQFCTSFHCS